MNKVTIIGRMTRDAELKLLGEDNAVANFTIAVDRRAEKGEEKEADFIPVVAWGKTAEAVANYSGKGKLIAASGRLQVRNYDHEDGTKRYVTEVIADEIQILEWAEREEEEPKAQPKKEAAKNKYSRR